MSRLGCVAAIAVPLALGEGCVLLAERNNNTSTGDMIILSLIGAPSFGLLFFFLPGLIIGGLIAARRYQREETN